MENSNKERQQLLRRALLANASFSTISGLVLVFAQRWVVRLLGLPETINLITLGISLLVFAAILVLFARKNPIKLLDAWIAVILDAAWVIGSYPLLFVVPFSTSGKWVVGIVAEVVMVFALMQWLGIRRIRKGNVLPEPARCPPKTSMRKLRWNWPVWMGFVFSIVAFVSYFFVFARFPVTRNVPWANFLLFGASAVSLRVGLRRVFGGAQPSQGRIVSSILTLLSVSIFSVFCFVIFHATRQLPASLESHKIGQKASEFALRDTHGKLVSLSTLLSAPLNPSSQSRSAPKGVLLIFYRGYW
jgi:hypothetical protein